MSRMNQNSRELIAYLAKYHPEGPFSSKDVPEHLKRCFGGLINHGFIERIGRGDKVKVFSVTSQGFAYAHRYASTEMDSAIKVCVGMVAA